MELKERARLLLEKAKLETQRSTTSSGSSTEQTPTAATAAASQPKAESQVKTACKTILMQKIKK